MARRAIGGVLLTGILLGLVAVVPVTASARDGAGAVGDAAVGAATLTPSTTPEAPIDASPLVLLLVACGIGSMGVLVREPVPERRRTRR